jgi:hypothetical protein
LSGPDSTAREVLLRAGKADPMRKKAAQRFVSQLRKTRYGKVTLRFAHSLFHSCGLTARMHGRARQTDN